jgi:hypothetical protein
MPRRDLRLLLLVTIVALAWATVQSVVGYDGGWTFLAPAIVVALPLLAGRYLGEDRIVGLARRYTASPPSRPPRVQGRPRAPQRLLWRGGALIAGSLAERPPPFALSA